MIKNYSSIALFIFIFGCSITSDSQSLNSSINPADLYSWVPADASELEQRRILQTKFDEIEKQIEVMFLKSDVLDINEIGLRGKIMKVFPEIESIDKDFSNRIDGEKKRIDLFGQSLDNISAENKKLNKDVEKISKDIKLDPVFSSKKYINAFISFKKGRYLKSVNLFRKSLMANPPYELTDNLLFGLGMSHYRLGNISKVSRPLSRLITQYPDSEKWYMSHLVLALTHYKKREPSQAIHFLEKGMKNNPPYFIKSMFMNLTQLIKKNL
jgi:tetratricopeptide (TPR) repeat protein